MEEIKRPADFPEEHWNELSIRKKLYWLSFMEKRGGYQEARTFFSERAHLPRKPSKLSAKQVEEIRNSNEGMTALSKKYNVHPTHIWRIRKGMSR